MHVKLERVAEKYPGTEMGRGTVRLPFAGQALRVVSHGFSSDSGRRA